MLYRNLSDHAGFILFSDRRAKVPADIFYRGSIFMLVCIGFSMNKMWK